MTCGTGDKRSKDTPRSCLTTVLVITNCLSWNGYVQSQYPTHPPPHSGPHPPSPSQWTPPTLPLTVDPTHPPPHSGPHPPSPSQWTPPTLPLTVDSTHHLPHPPPHSGPHPLSSSQWTPPTLPSQWTPLYYSGSPYQINHLVHLGYASYRQEGILFHITPNCSQGYSPRNIILPVARLLFLWAKEPP